MVEIHLPDGTVLTFPDGTSEEVIRAASARHASQPDRGAIRDALLGGTGPLDVLEEQRRQKREQLAGIARDGDVNAPGTTSSAEPPGPLSRFAGRDSKLYPLAEVADLGGAALGQSVIKPAVGLFSRAVSLVNPDPIIAEDTKRAAGEIRTALDSGFQGTRERFLEAHPTGIGPAVALGTEFASQAVPFLPGVTGAAARVGELGVKAAGKLAPAAFEAGSVGSKMLAHGLGGAAFGGAVGLGNADQDAPFADQAREVATGAALGGLMGGLGGAREVAALGARGAFLPSGKANPKFSEQGQPIIRSIPDAFEPDGNPVPAPPPEVRAQVLEAYQQVKGQVPPEHAPLVDREFHQAFARGAALGDEQLGALADRTAAAKAQPITTPPPLPDDFGRQFPTGITGVYHSRPSAELRAAFPDAIIDSKDVYAGPAVVGNDRRLRPSPLTTSPPPVPINPEAGFLKIGRKTPPPPADPFDAVMPQDPPAQKRSAGEVIRGAADRVTDEFFDKENAPVRRLRRAGMHDVAAHLETLQGRARGAAGMVEPGKAGNPFDDGTYVFDPLLPGGPGSRRTGDGLNAVLGGADSAALADLNAHMAAEHHMELVKRQEQAALLYDWQRAQRLHELRQARLADKESLRSMFTDVRAARGDEVAATRLVAREEMAARIHEAVGLQERSHAEDLSARSDAVGERALDAAEASAQVGEELAAASEQVRQAATYARQLLRQELAAAVRKPRPGEIPPLDNSGPRSPAAVQEADRMALALRSVAEQVGVSDGALHELLLRGRELDALGRQASGRAGAAEGNAALAWSRLGHSLPEAAAARQGMSSAVGSAQRVAMGVRDVAAKFRIPPIERPADLSLEIDPQGTALAQAKLQEHAQRYGARPDGRVATLADLADGVREWSVRAVIDPLVEAGRLTADQKEAILSKNEAYAPFFRIIDQIGEDPEILVGTTKANPLQKISGGLSPDRPIGLPLESFVQQAQKVRIWTERQRVRNVFADAVDASPELQKEIQPRGPVASGPPKPQAGTFPVWRDGVKHEYAAPADVVLAFERMTPKQAGIVLSVAKVAARTLRAGATLTPEFPFRNLLRDQATAAAYGAKYSYKPLVDPVVGLFDQILGDRGANWTREWRANGGAIAGAISSERPAIQAALADVVGHGGALSRAGRAFKAENLAGKVAFPILYPLEALATPLENASRVGAYRRARIKGASPVEAASFSRDITLDFARSGRFGQAWNSVEAFSNAELQDAYSFGRALRRTPVATTVKAMTYLTLPALANWAKNKDDPEYQALPEWEKVVFYHPAKRDDGTFWRFPRPLGLLNVAFSYGAHQLAEMIAGQDPDAAAKLMQAAADQTPAHFVTDGQGLNFMDMAPSALQPAIEAFSSPAGHSRFTGRDIVPRSMTDLLPEDQANDHTSGPARFLGSQMGVAPLKIDYLIQGYGATWGKTIAGALPGGGEQPPLPKTAKDVPIVRGFVSQPSVGFASQPVSDFFQLSTKAAEAAGSMEQALTTGDAKRYQQIAREHPEALMAPMLNDVRKQLSELRKMRVQIRSAEGMTPQERADQLLAIDQAATQLAGGYMHGVADYLRGQR